MPPDDVLDEFASTWKEWHYLAGGFALGVVVGTWVALRLLLMSNGQGAPHRRPGWDRPRD